MNDRIPKIKKKQIKDNLQPVDVNNRDVQNLLREINKTCLDTDFRNEWEAVGVSLVHNSELEEKYIKKRSELKDEGRTAASLQEQLGFLCVRPTSKTAIINNGLKATKQFYDRLGKGEDGVYINRFFDIELKSCWKAGDVSKEIFVFKYFPGKRKAITLNSLAGTETSLEPTPNYDCHTSSVQPKKEDAPFRQNALSSIYLYEYTDACEPAIYPRQCLPAAIIECKKRLVMPKPNPQILSKKENQQNSPVVNNDVLSSPLSFHKPVQSTTDVNQNTTVDQMKSSHSVRQSDALPSSHVIRSSSDEGLFNEKNLARRIDKRSAGSMEAFMQQTPQYIERLNEACAKVQNEKLTRSWSVIGSILSDTVANPASQPSLFVNSKCIQGSSHDIRDPRLSKGAARILDKKVSSTVVEKVPPAVSPHKKSGETKKMSYSEYLKLKAAEKEKTKDLKGSPGNKIQNELLHPSISDVEKGTASQKPMGLLNTGATNPSVTNPVCSNYLSKFQSPQVRPESNSDFYSQFQSPLPPQHSVSQNLFQSLFVSSSIPPEPCVQKNDSTSSKSLPSTSPKPRPRVEKKAFLPFPVVCEDGSIKNVYRGTIDGSVREIPSSASSSTKQCESEKPKSGSGESGSPSSNVKEGANKLYKVLQNVFADDRKKKLIERQLSNGKKEDSLDAPKEDGADGKSRLQDDNRFGKENLTGSEMEGSHVKKDIPPTSNNEDSAKRKTVGSSSKTSQLYDDTAPKKDASVFEVSSDDFNPVKDTDDSKCHMRGKTKDCLPKRTDNVVDKDNATVQSKSSSKCKDTVKSDHVVDKDNATVQSKSSSACKNTVKSDHVVDKDNATVQSKSSSTCKKTIKSDHAVDKDNATVQSKSSSTCKKTIKSDHVVDKDNATVQSKSSSACKNTVKSDHVVDKDNATVQSKSSSACKNTVKSDRKHKMRRDSGTAKQTVKPSVEVSVSKSIKRNKDVVERDATDKKKDDVLLLDAGNNVNSEDDIILNQGNLHGAEYGSKRIDSPQLETVSNISLNDNISVDSAPESMNHDELSLEDEVHLGSLLLPRDFNNHPRFVCRSPNADIPGVSFSLDFSAQSASTKPYCSPLRLIPSLCSEMDTTDLEDSPKEQECNIDKSKPEMSLEEKCLSTTPVEKPQFDKEFEEKRPGFGISRKGCATLEISPCSEESEICHSPNALKIDLCPFEGSTNLSKSVDSYYPVSLSTLPSSLYVPGRPSNLYNEKERRDGSKDESTTSGSIGSQSSSSLQPSVCEPLIQSTVSDKNRALKSTIHSESDVFKSHSRPPSISRQEIGVKKHVVSEEKSASKTEIQKSPLLPSSSSTCLIIDESYESSPPINVEQCVVAVEGDGKHADTTTTAASPNGSTDDDDEDTANIPSMPRSLSLEELGFSFYEQALSDMNYQPSITVVDLKEAQHKGYHHSSCNICKKEFPPHIVKRYVTETRKDDSHSDEEQVNVLESETNEMVNNKSNEIIQDKPLRMERVSPEKTFRPTGLDTFPFMSNATVKTSSAGCLKLNAPKERDVRYRHAYDRTICAEISRASVGSSLPTSENRHSNDVSKRGTKVTSKKFSSPLKDSLENYHSYKARLMKRQRERNQLTKIKEKLSNKGIVGLVKKRLQMQKNKVDSSNIEDDDELRDTLLDNLLTCSSDDKTTLKPKEKTPHEPNALIKTKEDVSRRLFDALSDKPQTSVNPKSNAKATPLDLYDIIEKDPCELDKNNLETKLGNKQFNISMVPRSAQKFLKKKEVVVPKRESAPHSQGSHFCKSLSSESKTGDGKLIPESDDRKSEMKKVDIFCSDKDDTPIGNSHKLESQVMAGKWKPISESDKGPDIDRQPQVSNDIHIKPIALKAKPDTKTHISPGGGSSVPVKEHSTASVMDHSCNEYSEQSIVADVIQERENSDDTDVLREENQNVKELSSESPLIEEGLGSMSSKLDETVIEVTHYKKPNVISKETSGEPVIESCDVTSSSNEEAIRESSICKEMSNVEESKRSLNSSAPQCVASNLGVHGLKSPDLSLYLDQPLGDVDYRAEFHFGRQNIGLPTTLSYQSEVCGTSTVSANTLLKTGSYGDVDYRTHIPPTTVSNSDQTSLPTVVSTHQNPHSLELFPNVGHSEQPFAESSEDFIKISNPISNITVEHTNSSNSVKPMLSTDSSARMAIESGKGACDKVMEKAALTEYRNAQCNGPISSVCVSDSKPPSDKVVSSSTSEMDNALEQDRHIKTGHLPSNSVVSSVAACKGDYWMQPKLECSKGDTSIRSVQIEAPFGECNALNPNSNLSVNPTKTASDEGLSDITTNASKSSCDGPSDIQECKGDDNNAVENIRKCFPDIWGPKPTKSEGIIYAYSDDEESDEETCPREGKDDDSVQIEKNEDLKQENFETTRISLSRDHLSMLKRAVDTVSQCIPAANSSSSLPESESLNDGKTEPLNVNLSKDHVTMLKKAINTVTHVMPTGMSVVHSKKEVLGTGNADLTLDQLAKLRKAISTFTHSAPAIKEYCPNVNNDSQSDHIQSSNSCSDRYSTDLKEEYSNKKSNLKNECTNNSDGLKKYIDKYDVSEQFCKESWELKKDVSVKVEDLKRLVEKFDFISEQSSKRKQRIREEYSNDKHLNIPVGKFGLVSEHSSKRREQVEDMSKNIASRKTTSRTPLSLSASCSKQQNTLDDGESDLLDTFVHYLSESLVAGLMKHSEADIPIANKARNVEERLSPEIQPTNESKQTSEHSINVRTRDVQEFEDHTTCTELNDSSDEQKVLLSDVPLEALTQAKLHVLEQLKSLNEDDDSGDDGPDFIDENCQLVLAKRQSPVCKEEDENSVDSGELPDTSEDEDNTGSHLDMRKNQTDSLRGPSKSASRVDLNIVNISSDSDAEELETPKKKKRSFSKTDTVINNYSFSRKVNPQLLQKATGDDFIEIISSSSDRSSYSSPVISRHISSPIVDLLVASPVDSIILKKGSPFGLNRKDSTSSVECPKEKFHDLKISLETTSNSTDRMVSSKSSRKVIVSSSPEDNDVEPASEDNSDLINSVSKFLKQARCNPELQREDKNEQSLKQQCNNKYKCLDSTFKPKDDDNHGGDILRESDWDQLHKELTPAMCRRISLKVRENRHVQDERGNPVLNSNFRRIPRSKSPIMDLYNDRKETVSEGNEKVFPDNERFGRRVVKRSSRHSSPETCWNSESGKEKHLKSQQVHKKESEVERDRRREENHEISTNDGLCRLSPSLVNNKRGVEMAQSCNKDKSRNVSPGVGSSNIIEERDKFALMQRFRNLSPDALRCRRKEGDDEFPIREKYRDSSPEIRRNKRKEENVEFPSRRYRDLSPDFRVNRNKAERDEASSSERCRDLSPDFRVNRNKAERDEASSSERCRDLSPDFRANRNKAERDEASSSERCRDLSPDFRVNRNKAERDEASSSERCRDLSPVYRVNKIRGGRNESTSSERCRIVSPDNWRNRRGNKCTEPASTDRTRHFYTKDENHRDDGLEKQRRGFVDDTGEYESSEILEDGKKEELDNSRRKLQNSSSDIVECEQRGTYSGQAGMSPISSSSAESLQFDENSASRDKRRRLMPVDDWDKKNRKVIIGRVDAHNNSRVEDARRHSDNSTYSGSDSLCSGREFSYSPKTEYSRNRENFTQNRSGSPLERSIHRKLYEKSRQASDLADYFSRNNSDGRSSRRRFEMRRDVSRSPPRARQHPLDELMEPWRKRKTPDADEELDYYINRKKRYYGHRDNYRSPRN